jgi:hexulose-6-phosphate isomerase
MVMANESGCSRNLSLNRRSFLGLGAGAVAAGASGVAAAQTAQSDAGKVVTPPTGKKILLATKLSMIAGEVDGKKLSLAERLRMAGQAGFDGVDFDEAGVSRPSRRGTPCRVGVLVHKAIITIFGRCGSRRQGRGTRAGPQELRALH